MAHASRVFDLSTECGVLVKSLKSTFAKQVEGRGDVFEREQIGPKTYHDRPKDPEPCGPKGPSFYSRSTHPENLGLMV